MITFAKGGSVYPASASFHVFHFRFHFSESAARFILKFFTARARSPLGSMLLRGLSQLISIAPLTWAPSSIVIRDVVRSPITDASLLTSTRSCAIRFPLTSPNTTISLELMSPRIWAHGPKVSRWLPSEIGPSIFPSISKSTSPFICPLIVSGGLSPS